MTRDEVQAILTQVVAVGPHDCLSHGKPCRDEQMWSALGELWRADPVLRQVAMALEDDGRSCPVPYAHFIAKRELEKL